MKLIGGAVASGSQRLNGPWLWPLVAALSVFACVDPEDDVESQQGDASPMVAFDAAPGGDGGFVDDAALQDGEASDSDMDPDQGIPLPEGTICFEGTLDVSPAGEGFEVTGERYRIYAEYDRERAEDLGRMLEAAWFAYESYFDTAPLVDPDEKLRVRLYRNYERFVAGMAEDGVEAPGPGAGGYFDPNVRTAYLYVQPTVYYTDALALHEAGHQFHRLSQAEWRDLPGWYVEGFAEYISRHDWDGRCVRLGIRPLLTQEDYPARALAQIEADGVDLEGIVDGSVGTSRPVMWALYSFLESGMDGALTAGFSTFRAALDGGTEEPHAAVFEREVGGLQALEAPLLEWLRGAQLPMWPVYLEWTHLRPDALWGHGANFTYALFRDPLAALSAEVRPAVAPWGLGLVIEYLDAGNYTGVVLFDEGGVSTFEVRDGSAIWWDQGQAVLPEMDDGLTVSVERGSGGMATVRFGESSFEFATTMPPILGLAVNDSDVRFEALRWRAVAE